MSKHQSSGSTPVVNDGKVAAPWAAWDGHERRRDILEVEELATEAAREAVAGIAAEAARDIVHVEVAAVLDAALGGRLAALEGRLLQALRVEVARQLAEARPVPIDGPASPVADRWRARSEVRAAVAAYGFNTVVRWMVEEES